MRAASLTRSGQGEDLRQFGKSSRFGFERCGHRTRQQPSLASDDAKATVGLRHDQRKSAGAWARGYKPGERRWPSSHLYRSGELRRLRHHKGSTKEYVWKSVDNDNYHIPLSARITDSQHVAVSPVRRCPTPPCSHAQRTTPPSRIPVVTADVFCPTAHNIGGECSS